MSIIIDSNNYTDDDLKRPDSDKINLPDGRILTIRDWNSFCPFDDLVQISLLCSIEKTTDA